MSFTLVRPAKAAGWNEMSFGRDSFLVASDTALDKDPCYYYY